MATLGRHFVIDVLSVVSSALSFAGSGFVITTYLRSRRIRRMPGLTVCMQALLLCSLRSSTRPLPLQIVFFVAVCAMVYAAKFCLAAAFNFAESQALVTTGMLGCTLSAMVGQFAALAVVTWSFVIALNLWSVQ